MKRKISWINILDIIIYGIIIGFISYATIKSRESYEAFLYVVREDGWVEYLTTLFLFAGSVVFAVNGIKAIRLKNTKQVVFNVLMFLMFVFGTGEEISWGQRLFGIESGDFFLEKNYQGETNLHNLEVGGIDLNILIFSQLMFIVLAFYFVFLALLAWKSKMIRKLVIDFGVPIPRLHHTIVLLVTNAAIPVFIGMKKESELHELALTGILLLVFLNPAKTIRDTVIGK
jgi:hypothetical protein